MLLSSILRRTSRISEVHETKQIGQAVAMPSLTQRQGANRHYMILRIFLGRLLMNDKGCRLNRSMQHMH